MIISVDLAGKLFYIDTRTQNLREDAMMNVKKILASALVVPMAIVFSFNAAALPAAAAADPASDFIFDSSTGTITGYCGSEFEGNLVIPSSIGGVTVKSIGNESFMCCGFSSVTIPDTVTTIGENAFNLSFNLESVSIPKSVTTIGSMAFADCQNLESIAVDSENPSYSSQDGVLFNKDKTVLIQYPIGKNQAYDIPSGVKVIADGAFYDCMENLPAVTIPNTVTDIGNEAFSGCTALSSVTIPSSVKKIGDRAFFYCSELYSVTIPDSVLTIGSSPFGFCKKLEGITVDSANTNYESKDGILFNKGKTELIQYPAGKTQTSFAVPDGVTTIGDEAFGWCSNLVSVSLPDSVTCIVKDAFIECESLASINLPSNITAISDGVFAYCAALSSITIPDGVKSIGDDAFKMCASLSDIKLPRNVVSIGYGAFGESGLKTIELGNVEKIGESAFWRCWDLASITVPASVTSIEKGAFRECPSLEKISVDPENKNFTSENGVLFNKDKTRLYQYPTAKIESSYVVPDSVTAIEDFAFSEASNLKELTIPKSVTSFGEGVFLDCENLTIYSAAGSAAQAYAKKAGIPFKEVSSALSNGGKIDNPKTGDTQGNELFIDLCALAACCGAAIIIKRRIGSKA